MYGSHNSLTGYKPIKWWGRLLQPFARCQRETVEGQIEGGTRAFDLRVRFDGKGSLVACHGWVEYVADVPEVIARLENARCCYRLVLENVMGGRKIAADNLDRLKGMFLTREHPHCLYVSDKRDWNTSHNPYCPIRFKEQNRHGGTGCVIPRLWLWKYGRDRYRHSLNLKCDDETIYWYDFIKTP